MRDRGSPALVSVFWDAVHAVRCRRESNAAELGTPPVMSSDRIRVPEKKLSATPAVHDCTLTSVQPARCVASLLWGVGEISSRSYSAGQCSKCSKHSNGRERRAIIAGSTLIQGAARCVARALCALATRRRNSRLSEVHRSALRPPEQHIYANSSWQPAAPVKTAPHCWARSKPVL